MKQAQKGGPHGPHARCGSFQGFKHTQFPIFNCEYYGTINYCFIVSSSFFLNISLVVFIFSIIFTVRISYSGCPLTNSDSPPQVVAFDWLFFSR